MGKVLGRTVLVTGASAGIGLATAHKLIDNGWRVYAAARRTDRMDELKSRGAHILDMDIANPESVERAVKKVFAGKHGLDVLVNNAGLGEYGALEEASLDRARYQFEVNVFGLVYLTQLVLPHMRKRGSGRIINVTSMGGIFSLPMGGWYHASKYAVEALSDSLRQEIRPFGIDVIVVQPGVTQSEWSGIAYRSLENTSKNGPYAQLAQRVKKAGLEFLKSKRTAQPAMIGKVIVKAAEAKCPRSRYRAPFHAKVIALGRRLTPDRLLDAIIRRQMKL